MDQLSHVRNILEALRGKSVIDAINIDGVVEREPQNIPDTYKISSMGEYRSSIHIDFEQNFSSYVNWDYYSAVRDASRFVKDTDKITIYAHQLFDDMNKMFRLTFGRDNFVFYKRSNIEDTLFLDIQRYMSENKIAYEVMDDETHQ